MHFAIFETLCFGSSVPVQDLKTRNTKKKKFKNGKNKIREHDYAEYAKKKFKKIADEEAVNDNEIYLHICGYCIES